MKIRFPRKHLEKMLKQASLAKHSAKVSDPFAPRTPPKHPDYVEIDDVLRIRDPTEFTFEHNNRLDDVDNKRIKKGAQPDANSDSQSIVKSDQVGVENETESIATMVNEEKTTDVTVGTSLGNMDNSASIGQDSSDIGTASTDRTLDSKNSQSAAGDMKQTENADEIIETTKQDEREPDSNGENVTSMLQESVTMSQLIESNEQKPMDEASSPITTNEQSKEAPNEVNASENVGDSLAVTETIIGSTQEIPLFNVNQPSENTEVLEIAVRNTQENSKTEENSTDGNTSFESMLLLPTEAVPENGQRAISENENSGNVEILENETTKTDLVEGDNSANVDNALTLTDALEMVIEKKANEDAAKPIIMVEPNQADGLAMQTFDSGTVESSSPMPVPVIAMDDVQQTDVRVPNKDEEMDNTLVTEPKDSSLPNARDGEIMGTQSEVDQTDNTVTMEPSLGSARGEQSGETTSKSAADAKEEQQKIDTTELEATTILFTPIETTLSPLKESDQDTRHEATTVENTASLSQVEELTEANLGSVQQMAEENSTEEKKFGSGTTESARAAEEMSNNSEAPTSEPTVGGVQQSGSQSVDNTADVKAALSESDDQKSATVEVTESTSIEPMPENAKQNTEVEGEGKTTEANISNKSENTPPMATEANSTDVKKANQEDSQKESDAKREESNFAIEPVIGSIQQITTTAESIAADTELPSTPTQQTTMKSDIVNKLDEGKSTTIAETATKSDVADSKTSGVAKPKSPNDNVNDKPNEKDAETTTIQSVTSTPKPQQNQNNNATDKPVNKTEPVLHGIHPLIQRVMLGSPNPTPSPKPLQQFFEHLQKRAPLLASFFKIRSFAQQPLPAQQPPQQPAPTQKPLPTQQPPTMQRLKKNVKRGIADGLVITPKPFDSFSLSSSQAEDLPRPTSLLHQYFSLSSGERAVRLSKSLEKAMHALTVASHVDGYLTHRLGTTIKKAHKIFVPSEEQQ